MAASSMGAGTGDCRVRLVPSQTTVGTRPRPGSPGSIRRRAGGVCSEYGLHDAYFVDAAARKVECLPGGITFGLGREDHLPED
jgi:hypothetical protein